MNYARNGRHRVRVKVNATRITVSAKVNVHPNSGGIYLRTYLNSGGINPARVRVKVNATRVKVSAKVNAARVRVKVYATRVKVSAKVNAARVRVKEYATRFQKRRKIPLGPRKMPSIIRSIEADMNVCRGRPLTNACAATYVVHHFLSIVG